MGFVLCQAMIRICRDLLRKVRRIGELQMRELLHSRIH
jgi:hypothetical protein